MNSRERVLAALAHCEVRNGEKFLDALMEKHTTKLEKVCKTVGDTLDSINFGDDPGGMNRPFMAPDTYRNFFNHMLKQLYYYTHKNSNAHTFLDSSKLIYKLNPDLVEVGFDVLNPVQSKVTDMQPEKLKREFGWEKTFRGGEIERLGTLDTGSHEKVLEQVLVGMEIVPKGGGFVLNTAHKISHGVPAEKEETMFNAVKEFSGEKSQITIDLKQP